MIYLCERCVCLKKNTARKLDLDMFMLQAIQGGVSVLCHRGGCRWDQATFFSPAAPVHSQERYFCSVHYRRYPSERLHATNVSLMAL